jgi:hypothetical protein
MLDDTSAKKIIRLALSFNDGSRSNGSDLRAELTRDDTLFVRNIKTGRILVRSHISRYANIGELLQELISSRNIPD